MSETKKELRWFSIMDYEKEARYLSRMHQKGWKFKRVTMPGIYTFEKCEPEKVIYQLDYNLEGMTKAEGHSYVAAKLNGAGCTQTVFEDNALEAILNAANGTPRMINKLCNASLLVGNSSNLNIITADAVMQAIEAQWEGYLALPPVTLGDTLLLANELSPVTSPLYEIGTIRNGGSAPIIDSVIDEQTLSGILAESAAEVESLTVALRF